MPKAPVYNEFYENEDATSTYKGVLTSYTCTRRHNQVTPYSSEFKNITDSNNSDEYSIPSISPFTQNKMTQILPQVCSLNMPIAHNQKTTTSLKVCGEIMANITEAELDLTTHMMLSIFSIFVLHHLVIFYRSVYISACNLLLTILDLCMTATIVL